MSTLSDSASTRFRRRQRLRNAQRLGLGKSFVRPAMGIGLGMLAALAIALAMWAYHGNEDFRAARKAEAASLETLKAEMVTLTAEKDELSSAFDTVEKRLDAERAAQNQVLAQVAAVEAENLRLREELSLFQELAPTMAGASGISIAGFKVEQVGPAQLHYRFLVLQGDQDARQAFDGELEVVARMAGGGNATMALPADGTPVAQAPRQRLEFKGYQHVDGFLTIPEGASIEALQARVIQNGRVRAQQSAHL